MDPMAASGQRLYVSNNALGTVNAYTYPEGRLVGTLTGFISPFGECTDAAGDVFIVAYSDSSKKSSTIYEYAHGGTAPIATLSDPTVAFGCAIDPRPATLRIRWWRRDLHPCHGNSDDVLQFAVHLLLLRI